MSAPRHNPLYTEPLDLRSGTRVQTTVKAIIATVIVVFTFGVFWANIKAELNAQAQTQAWQGKMLESHGAKIDALTSSIDHVDTELETFLRLNGYPVAPKTPASVKP